MRLYAKAITTYNSINSFKVGNQWTIRTGEPNTLYFQLIDLDQDSLRYIPQTSPIVVKVTFPSIDDAAVMEKTATLVNAADGSLFKIDLTALEIPSSGNVAFSVREDTVTRRFQGLSFISVEQSDPSECC